MQSKFFFERLMTYLLYVSMGVSLLLSKINIALINQIVYQIIKSL